MQSPFKKFPTYYPFQEEVISGVLQSEKKFIFIDAPPGTGKSIVGMSLAYNKKRSLYLCTTKQLQLQLQGDFPGYSVLFGRSNYPCNLIPNEFPRITCEDCIVEGDESSLCKGTCKYQVAKKQAVSSHIAILNTIYYITETNYIGQFCNTDFTVIDECDRLERTLLNFIEINVSHSILERLDLLPPKFKTKWESWKEWTDPVIEKLTEELNDIEVDMENVNSIRYYKKIKSLLNKMVIFKKVLNDTWTYQEINNKFGINYNFKPTWLSREITENFFWNKSKQFILMSGSIFPRKSKTTDMLKLIHGESELIHLDMATILGLRPEEWDYIETPNQFPAEKRPIYFKPTANLTSKTMEIERGLLIPEISNIMDKYPRSKGLIHTVSYPLGKYLIDHLYNKRIISHESGLLEKEKALHRFKTSNEPLVMISPTMDRGIDLPYDACRFIIIIKVPYPDLGDKQISKRLYSSSFGKIWYRWVTTCSIVQMSMRGMRAPDDMCEIWILDKQFDEFFSNNSFMFPSWWRDALHLETEWGW